MPQRPDEADLPAWAMKVIMRGSAAYAIASTLASSIALGHLAWEAGYHDPRAVLFGVAFEVACAVTGTAWAAAARGSWWHDVGKRATIGLIAASLIFNGAEVLQVRDLLPAGLLLVVAVLVSFVFPLLALVFGHLGLVARRAATPPASQPLAADDPATGPAAEVERTDDVADDRTADPVEPAPAVRALAVAPAAVPPPAAGADTDRSGLRPVGTRRAATLQDKVTTYVRTARENRTHHGERTIAREFRVSRKEAKELLDAAKAALDTTPATTGARVPLPTAGA